MLHVIADMLLIEVWSFKQNGFGFTPQINIDIHDMKH